MAQDPAEVTELLLAWRRGDAAALDQLVPIVYGELHRIARGCMLGERAGQTLQATALVNEAFQRLVDIQRVDWKDRGHFLSMAARLMRRVLVDAARHRGAEKRGGDFDRITFDEELVAGRDRAAELLKLDDALEALSRLDQRKSQVIELRFFGGLSVEETAEALGVSAKTVARDWEFAKVWLQREIRGRKAEDAARPET